MLGVLGVAADGFWPHSLVVAVAIGHQLTTFPRSNHLDRVPERNRSVVLTFAIISIMAAGVCVFYAIRKPDHLDPPSESVKEQPSDFVPMSEWPVDFRAKVDAILTSEAGANYKIHGLQRGLLRDGGWRSLTSTGGGFLIEMPGEAMDLRVLTSASDGVTIAIDVLQTQVADLKLRAICLRRADGKVIAEVPTGFAPRSPSETTEVTLDGMRVEQYIVPSAHSRVQVRRLNADGAVWVWSAEYPTEKEQSLSGDIQRFLYSFKR
jgi:hypothetical protein